MKVVTHQIHLLCIMWALGTFFPCLMSTLSFYTNILLGNTIDLATAFTVLIFFDKIRGPMNALPQIINNTLEMLTSLTRIQNFIDMKELKIENFLETQKDSEDQEYSIQVSKSHFTWGLASVDEDSKQEKKEKKEEAKKEKPKKKCCIGSKQTEENDDETKEETVSIDQLVVLKDLDFKIKRGEFVCIIGDVGAGKSSLLSSIIGDLIPVSPSQADNLGIKGQGFDQYITKKEAQKFSDDILNKISENNQEKVIKTCGEIAYVQQTPWIENKTIRDNITFDMPMDKERYVDTIQLCEMERDLEILGCGDLTEIGEKGINLSGGQKARVGLARAVYA